MSIYFCEFIISCIYNEFPSTTNLLEQFFGNVTDHVSVIVNIDNSATYLAFLIADSRTDAHQFLNISYVFTYNVKSSTSRNMAGNFHKNIQNRKIANYAVVNIYFNNFFRPYF